MPYELTLLLARFPGSSIVLKATKFSCVPVKKKQKPLTPTQSAYGARHVQGRAGAGGQTGSRRQRDDRCRHDLSSLSGVASGIPSRAATFFWISIIASACSNRRPSRAFSRLACTSSAAKGLRAADLGPRLAGISA